MQENGFTIEASTPEVHLEPALPAEIPTPFEDRVNALNPAARERWQKTGDLDGAEKLSQELAPRGEEIGGELAAAIASDDQAAYEAILNNQKNREDHGVDAQTTADQDPHVWLQEAVREHPDLPISFPAMDHLLNGRKDGAKILRWLGENPETAAALANETGLGIQSKDHYHAVIQESRRNPDVARELHAALTRADGMLNQIAKKIGRHAAAGEDFVAYERRANLEATRRFRHGG